MVLKETKNNIEKFTEIYNKDRFLARIYALEKQPSISYIVLNEVSKIAFQIFYSTHSYGVSKTLKRYMRKRTTKKFFVNNGRFFISEKRSLFPLCLSHIDDEAKKIFIERFSWVRFLIENNFNAIPFNTIVTHKLYSRDSVLKYLYKCPVEKALLIKNSHIERENWKTIIKVSFNAENLNPELLQTDSLLVDTACLAWKLNEKINLSWSYRRLKEEHDNWSRIFTKYVIELDNEPLNVRLIFKDFDEFFGGGLITQSGLLAQEGYTQHHCVATYKHRVNSGQCAIFHINGFTAELKSNGHAIYLNQFKGLRNCNAPEDLKLDITKKIEQFNQSIKNKTYPAFNFSAVKELDYLELPF